MNTARPPNPALCCGDVEPGSREYSTVHPQCRQRPPTGLALPLPRAKEDPKVQSYKDRTVNGGWMWRLHKSRTPPQRENVEHVEHLRLCQGFIILIILGFFEGAQGAQHSHWGEGGRLRIARCGGVPNHERRVSRWDRPRNRPGDDCHISLVTDRIGFHMSRCN